jgi:hypothetical protein
MLDVQNLCLDPGGADYIQSIGGAPSGGDTLGPAKRVLERARGRFSGLMVPLGPSAGRI